MTIAEGLLIDQYTEATEAILGRLAACGEPQNFCQIAERVFMGIADEPLLYRLLLTLVAQRLISQTGRDVYRITPAGRQYIEVNHVTAD